MQYQSSGRKWTVLSSSAHIWGGKLKYTFTLTKKGSYTLAVLVHDNSVYIGGHGQTHVKIT